MEKVCMRFSIVLLTLSLLYTNDIQISEILTSIGIFIILYNLFLYFDKYLKARRERQKFELIIKSLQKYIEWKSTQ